MIPNAFARTLASRSAAQWLLWLVLPRVLPEGGIVAVMAGMAGGALVVLWWLFFSRAAWLERIAALVLMVVGVLVVRSFLHESIATAGQGMMFYMFVVPVLSLAFVVWAVATRDLTDATRRATMAAAILLGCGVLALVRTYGVGGGFTWDLDWRWARSPEERFLAELGDGRQIDDGCECVLFVLRVLAGRQQGAVRLRLKRCAAARLV